MVGALFGVKIILMSLACHTGVMLLLLIIAIIAPVDFTRWTVVLLVLFVIVFVFAVASLVSMFTFKLPIMQIVYSLIIVTLLSLAMLLNLQVLFNGAIFELYPDDVVLGSILMFADIV